MRTTSQRAIEYGVMGLFIGVMAGANLLINHYGPWMLPVTAFFAVGVALVSRDYLHDVWRLRTGSVWPRMVGMIAAAALLAYAVDNSAGRVAIASVAALTATALTETVAFQALIRQRWMIRSNGSNILGAVADSITFPLVAFGFGVEGLVLLVLTQAATKTLGGFFWSAVARFTLNPDRLRERRAATV